MALHGHAMHRFTPGTAVTPRVESHSIIERFNEARAQLARAKDRHREKIEDGKTMLKTAIYSAETVATAFSFGMVAGRFGEVNVFGVPVDLIAGIGSHLGGFFLGPRDDVAPHLHAVGNGALAAHFCHVGRGIGKDWRTRAGLPALAGAPAADAGRIEETGGASLSDEELARLVRRS